MKISIRQIINQIFDLLPEVEQERNEKCGEDIQTIQRNIDCKRESATQRLKSFIMGLKEEQVRKVLTLYFAGRDDEKDIYGQYYYSQRGFPSKECMVSRLLSTKTLVLRDSLLLGLWHVDEQNIDLEDSFNVNDEK